jgi:hypothetical protein
MLGANELNGTIPTELGRLTSLAYLDLGKIKCGVFTVAPLTLVCLIIHSCDSTNVIKYHALLYVLNDRCQPAYGDDPNGARTAFKSNLFGCGYKVACAPFLLLFWLIIDAWN